MTIRKSSNSGIPFGNTSGRPGSPSLGQPYFNGQTARLELYTDTGWQNIVQETPGVASASGTYNQSAGSGTFTVAGTNFVDGAIAYAVGTNGTEYQATTTTYNSLVQLTVVFSNLSAEYEPYDIKITNPSNLFGLLPDAFSINDSPVWSTTAGSLGAWSGSSIQLSATDDESNTITYSLTSGSLPTGLSLSSSGLISGTSTAASGTYTFTVSASDGVNTAVTRSFSLVIPVSVTGGTLTSDSTYYYRTFSSTGNFVSNISLQPDILIVAGGGGGGDRHGGGGGAGGYRALTSQTFAPATYTVTVGAGGGAGLYESPATWAGQTYAGAGLPGIDSSIIGGSINLVSVGGGGGGTMDANPPGGASGGGGGGGNHPGISTSVSGQGNSGGSGLAPNSGGGGGAGATGGNASGNSGGNGGAGLQWLNGTSYSGGGGGCPGAELGTPGSGGVGGGGAGGWDLSIAGTQNTGGGGGGCRSNSANTQGQPGGSGIVIFRYTKSSVGD
jgi:hypothetical protein